MDAHRSVAAAHQSGARTDGRGASCAIQRPTICGAAQGGSERVDRSRVQPHPASGELSVSARDRENRAFRTWPTHERAIGFHSRDGLLISRPNGHKSLHIRYIPFFPKNLRILCHLTWTYVSFAADRRNEWPASRGIAVWTAREWIRSRARVPECPHA